MHSRLQLHPALQALFRLYEIQGISTTSEKVPRTFSPYGDGTPFAKTAQGLKTVPQTVLTSRLSMESS